ncbi:MAG: FitA-like ribbon-helix-helix domain-containing protein [Puniceicoccales bacterium]
MNYTVKGISEQTHARLRQRAEANGRSLNKEMLAIFDQAVDATATNREQIWARIRERRARLPQLITDSDTLEEMIEQGRA